MQTNGLLIPGWKCKYCGRVIKSELATYVTNNGSVTHRTYEEAVANLMREV
jgi:hypothetical protein